MVAKRSHQLYREKMHGDLTIQTLVEQSVQCILWQPSRPLPRPLPFPHTIYGLLLDRIIKNDVPLCNNYTSLFAMSVITVVVLHITSHR
mmetsp:Transcript_20985/g.34601  ORF Transcript_20985/g.34601 Transcript_20985/m.34601 type:complete len:89 (-) Transcript_20985:126-392(-)